MINKKSHLYKTNFDALKKDKYNSLTNEELVELYKQTGDEEVFNHLFAKNYGLILKMVNYFSNWYEYSDDELLTICLEAFYYAVLGYKKITGELTAKFSTYLFNTVKRSICNERQEYIGGGNRILGQKILSYRGVHFNIDEESNDFDPYSFDDRIKVLVDNGVIIENSKYIGAIKNALEINFNSTNNVNVVSEDEAFRSDEISAQTDYINENFSEMTKGISGLDWYVFNKYFGFSGKACSTYELAKELGVTYTRIIQRIDRALNIIKKNMDKPSFKNKKKLPEGRVKLPKHSSRPVSKDI